MPVRKGGLTTRQREVARLIASGQSNRAIADEFTVGISTIESHVHAILAELGFHSPAQIAAWWVSEGQKIDETMEEMG